jgi:hypothetical protein
MRSFVELTLESKKDRGNSEKGCIFGILITGKGGDAAPRGCAPRAPAPHAYRTRPAGRWPGAILLKSARLPHPEYSAIAYLPPGSPSPKTGVNTGYAATLKTGYAGLALTAAATLHRRRHHPRHQLLPLLLLLLRPLVSDACPSPAAVSLSLRRRQRCSYS